MKVVVTLVSLSLLGCYGAAPPRPPNVPLPPMSEGAALDVHTVTKTEIESVDHTASTCPQGHSEGDPLCVVTHYQQNEPVTRTHSTLSYDGQPINYGQFRVMTDPKYSDKLSTLEDLSHKCTRANVPRYAGMGLLLGGVIAGQLIGGDVGAAVLWTGLAGGIASYSLGYFAFGGRDCNEAAELFRQIDMSRALEENTVEGLDYAAEMKSLADQFNATHSSHASAMKMR